jgi:hypothetical protein
MIETVERHYMPFVQELRERVRVILETGVGIEKLPSPVLQAQQNDLKKPN